MKTSDTVSIPREAFDKLVKRNRQLAYINLFLVQACAIRNIDLFLLADEVCELFRITPEQLEECRRKRQIHSGVFNHRFLYHASDIVLLAEKLSRK